MAVFLTHRSVECMTRLAVQLLSRRVNQEAEVVVDIIQDSVSVIIIKSSYPQRISSTSCSLAKIHNNEVKGGRRPTITNDITSKSVEKMQMKVNCYFANLVHS